MESIYILNKIWPDENSDRRWRDVDVWKLKMPYPAIPTRRVRDELFLIQPETVPYYRS